MSRFLIPLLVALPCSLATAQTTVINTIAGNGTQGYSGNNVPAVSAELNQPAAVALDSSGDVYIADTGNADIRMINPAGVITTIAGTGCCGYSGDGSPAASASFDLPSSIAIDSSGNIYIADTTNSVVRKIAAGTGIITTIAGKVGAGGYNGDGGPAVNASLFYPYGVAVDSSGNVYIADTYDNVIRKITASTGIISTVAGYGAQQGFGGDGGSATASGVALDYPKGVFVDSAGNIFIADTGNNRVREVTASSGNINTVAGNGVEGSLGDGGPATSAELYDPIGLAVDSSGNLYIASTLNNKIREVSGGTINTLAGDGAPVYFGDGGNPIYAGLNHPQGVAVNPSGGIYIADTGNNVIREVTAATAPAPTITPNGIVPVYSTVSTIQPSEWISIFGTNLGPSPGVTWSGNFPNGQFPTSLAGTSVTIDGNPAYVEYVSSTQINLQVPNDANATPRSVPVVVTVGSQSAASSVNLASVAPSFSLLPDNKHVAGIVVHSDGTYSVIGPTGTSLGYTTVPATAGDMIELFGVGFGPTNPSVPAGQALSLPAGVAAQTTNPVTLSINGQNVPTEGTYLSEAGLYQINLTIPSGLGAGDQPLVATVAGVSTQTGVVIALQ